MLTLEYYIFPKDKIYKVLLSKKNVNFGAFLASLAAGFKVCTNSNISDSVNYLGLP